MNTPLLFKTHAYEDRACSIPNFQVYTDMDLAVLQIRMDVRRMIGAQALRVQLNESLRASVVRYLERYDFGTQPLGTVWRYTAVQNTSFVTFEVWACEPCTTNYRPLLEDLPE